MNDETRGQKIRRWMKTFFLYSLVFDLAFFTSVYWSFPYGRIAERGLAQAQKTIGAKIEFGDVGPHLLTGIEATDVRIEKSSNQGPLVLELSSLSARLHPLDSLLSGPTVDFSAESELGEISGVFRRPDETTQQIELSIEGLEVGMLPGVWDSLGVGFAGSATGEVNLTIPTEDPNKVSGKVALNITEAKFGGGMVKNFTVPPMGLGDVPLSILAEDGRLVFEPPLKIDGPDLQADVSGSIELAGRFAMSKADLELSFQPTEKFMKENETLASLAGAVLGQAKGKDGRYSYTLKGRLGRPNFRPNRR